MQRMFDSLGVEEGALPVFSGTSGAGAVMEEEIAFLKETGRNPAVRAYGSVFGHTVEAHFPLGVALAALAVKRGGFPVPFDVSGVEKGFDGAPKQVLVTGMGAWRGEGLALVATV